MIAVESLDKKWSSVLRKICEVGKMRMDPFIERGCLMKCLGVYQNLGNNVGIRNVEGENFDSLYAMGDDDGEQLNETGNSEDENIPVRRWGENFDSLYALDDNLTSYETPQSDLVFVSNF